MNQDAEHLRMLSIAHYAYAVLIGFFSMFGLIYVLMGLAVATMPWLAPMESPPASAASPVEAQHSTEPPFEAAFPVSESHRGAPPSPGEPPPEWIAVAFGALFALGGLAFVFFGLLYAAATFYAGRSLAGCRRRVFCLIVAAFHCTHAPLGTLLGVFTLLVLFRPSVQQLFQSPFKPAPPRRLSH